MEKKKVAAGPKRPKVISLQMDATFFFERAVRSLDRLHYDKALKYFRRAVEYEPENPVNHCNLAGILSEMGNYEDSNRILRKIVDEVDPTMTECYFYMANNYANMEDFEAAEKAIIYYLENDPDGQYMEESEEMIELLSYELDRPTPLTFIKSRESLFEHDKARGMLEEGRFAEAIRILQKIIRKYPDFLAARNNLALAYYYIGQFEKAMDSIGQVLELEPGNLHALCNLAIFYQHFGAEDSLEELLALLRKTYPFHPDHLFKLATTMGILGEDESAYRQFKRLLKMGEEEPDPTLYHYTAVSCFNTSKYLEARRYWVQAEKIDPKPDVPRFFLSRLEEGHLTGTRLSYHYHLPYEEQLRMPGGIRGPLPELALSDPLIRSSFFWALRHGDAGTKLQVIQAFALMADPESEEALREFVRNSEEDEYLKRIAFFALRTLGVSEPMEVTLDGQTGVVPSTPLSFRLPEWKLEWQKVLDLTWKSMHKRYDMIQQHDLETLWVEYLTRVDPESPIIRKPEGWAAALEYLTSKMHRGSVSYGEAAARYGVSASTVSRIARQIDAACGLDEKMKAIYPEPGEWVKPQENGELD